MKSNTLKLKSELLRKQLEKELAQFKLPISFLVSFFFIILSTGFVAYSRRQFNEIIQTELMSRLHCIITDATGSLVSAILLCIVAVLTYKNPLWRKSTTRTIILYFFVVVVHCALFIVFSTLFRQFVFQVLHLEHSEVILWSKMVQTEIPPQIFMLTVTIATIHGLLFFQRSNAEQLRILKVEQQLTKEKLRSLQGQLNPHFLFNTLNTISAMMYEDVSAADRMIEHLSGLLRASFKLNSLMELPLKDELKLVDAYTSIMLDRFPGKFTVNIESDTQSHDVLVPPLLLQPLIENCFKHGRLDTLNHINEMGKIEILISEHQQRLHITILDNGYAQSEKTSSTISHSTVELESNGLGLNLSLKRLKLLYRDQATLQAGPRKDQRGYQVQITLPARRNGAYRQFSPTPQELSYPIND